jgi:hypothetical protein
MVDTWIVLAGAALVLVALAARALLRANRLVGRILAELPPAAPDSVEAQSGAPEQRAPSEIDG